MHIAFWSPAWPLEKFQNGIVTYVHWMKVVLEREGHRVSVFTRPLEKAAAPFADNHIHPVKLRIKDRIRRRIEGVLGSSENSAFLFSEHISRAILDVHRRDRIDILEMEESFGWFADVEKRISLPVPVKLHGPAFLSLVDEELDSPFGREKIDREGWALKRASTIISPAVHTLEQTVSFYGLTPARQVHIVNPVEMPPDTPIWDSQSCDRRMILCVGRFDLRKGADVLLRAFKDALRDRSDLKLTFVGPDHGLPATDGRRLQFREYLHQLLPREQWDRVDFRGSLPNREVAELRTQAMVTVVASRWENQSYAVLEAMLQGCPVVCTDAGGCPENITDGVTGLLAKSGDPSSFTTKILQMLDYPAAAAAMGEAARRHVLREHAIAHVAEKSLRLYEDLIRTA